MVLTSSPPMCQSRDPQTRPSYHGVSLSQYQCVGYSYKVAVRALIPLVVTSVAVPVVVASASGGVGKNLVVYTPVVADAEGSSSVGSVLAVGDANGLVVKLGRGTMIQVLIKDEI